MPKGSVIEISIVTSIALVGINSASADTLSAMKNNRLPVAKLISAPMMIGVPLPEMLVCQVMIGRREFLWAVTLVTLLKRLLAGQARYRREAGAFKFVAVKFVKWMCSCW